MDVVPAARHVMRPHHQRRVRSAHRDQVLVVIGPADVGHVGTVAHVFLELGIFALDDVDRRILLGKRNGEKYGKVGGDKI